MTHITEPYGGIKSLRPFVPAKDFDISRRFYLDVGFTPEPLGNDLIAMHLGAFGFNLQRFYVKEFADNFVMHVTLGNLRGFWTHISSMNLAEKYHVPPPREPKLQPWGLTVAYIFDPSGVLWHFAQIPENGK